MRFKAAVCLCIALLLGACAPEQPPAGQTYLKGFSCNEGPYAIRLPRDHQKLRRMPKFVSEKVLAEDDQESQKLNGFSTKSYELSFKGLKVGLVTFSNGIPPWWGMVHISDSNWNISGPLRVGAKASELSKLIEKGRLADGEWRFHGGDADILVVVVKESKISDIVYQCYTG